jgi:hypothetical protein
MFSYHAETICQEIKLSFIRCGPDHLLTVHVIAHRIELSLSLADFNNSFSLRIARRAAQLTVCS